VTVPVSLLLLRLALAVSRKDRNTVAGIAKDPRHVVALAALEAADEISGIHPAFKEGPVELQWNSVTDQGRIINS